MASKSSALDRRYRLVRLDREELRFRCKMDDYEVWGAPDLTLPTYQLEEALQRMTAHAVRGLIVWGLVPRKDDDPGLENDEHDDSILPQDPIVCHCESYKFDCMIKKQHGGIIRGHSFHLTSVYTLPAYRNQGLARHFLTSVRQRLEQSPKALASVLFSEIGPIFYERLGWQSYYSTSATLLLRDPKNAHQLQRTKKMSELKPLHLDHTLDMLLQTKCICTQQAMRSAQFNMEEVFYVIPSTQTIEWQFYNGIFHAVIQKRSEIPTRCGVYLNASSFIVWCHDLRRSVLNIVYYCAPPRNTDVSELLLQAALFEARKFELESIDIWDPPRSFEDAAIKSKFGIVVTERTDAISSLMIFDSHHQRTRLARPHWLVNQRYAWV